MSRTPSQAKSPVTTQPEQPVLQNQSKNHGLSKKEFIDCQQCTLSVLRRCPDSYFPRLSVLISCLTFCFRALHRVEICEIWRSLLTSPDQENDVATAEMEDWIFSECEQLLFLDTNEICQFSNPSFRRFFSAAPIPGIDRSHATLARASIMLMRGSCSSTDSSEATPSPYASTYWPAHYTQVQHTHPGLTAQVHRMLIPESIKVSGEQYTCFSLSSAFTFCQRAGFSVLSQLYGHMLACRHLSGSRNGGDFTRCAATCHRHINQLSSNHDETVMAKEFAALDLSTQSGRPRTLQLNSTKPSDMTSDCGSDWEIVTVS